MLFILLYNYIVDFWGCLVFFCQILYFYKNNVSWGLPMRPRFTLACKKTAKGRRPSPRHPWAGCLTEIWSYGMPFEKFSWCIKSREFRINISANLHGCPMSLRLLMLLVFLYGSDLHLKLTNPTYFIVLCVSAVSHTTGPSTPRLRRARGNARYRKLKLSRLSRQRNSPNSWRQRCSVLMHQAWPKRGSLRGIFGLRNFEIFPLRVFSFVK